MITSVPYTDREIALASAILQGLVARGEFGKGSFDRLLTWTPCGDEDCEGEEVEVAPTGGGRMAAIVVFSLTAARDGLALAENRMEPDEDEEDLA